MVVSLDQVRQELQQYGRILTPGFQAGWVINLDGTPGKKLDLIEPGNDCIVSPGCLGCTTFFMVKNDLLTTPVCPVSKFTTLLQKPFQWGPGKVCFLSPRGDLLHGNISDEVIYQVLAMVESLSQHRFVLLTKWAERLQKLFTDPLLHTRIRDVGTQLFGKLYQDRGDKWCDNLVIGVSVENQDWLHRAEALVDLPKTVTTAIFAAPMIGPLDIRKVSPFTKWVSCSGERGSKWLDKPRPCKEEWQKDLKEQCKEAEIPFYMDRKYHQTWVKRMGGPCRQLPKVLTE